jgi:acylphosphatase
VEGLVQGVGFRYSTLRLAARLGLTGYVMNLPDGSVEVVAEGDPARLDQLKGWLQKGPPGAWIRKVKLQELPPSGAYREFSIEY